jgi:hypothetical protein
MDWDIDLRRFLSILISLSSPELIRLPNSLTKSVCFFYTQLFRNNTNQFNTKQLYLWHVF